MPKLLVILVVLSISFTATSQGFLGKSKRQVKRNLAKYSLASNAKPVMHETDSTIELLIRDSSYKEADFIYKFNNRNRCVAEYRVACDSCLQKYLHEALDKKAYQWIEIDPRLFVSAYSRHLLIEVVPGAQNQTMIIRKIDWTRKEYNQFLQRTKRVSI
jgi:hypothetical protein